MSQLSVQANPDLYQWGVGAVSPTLPTYVEREADHQIVEELLEGKLCYVLTARQMGKSSLVVRAQQHLRDRGIASVNIDLSGFGKTSTEEQWYYNQVDTIGDRLQFPEDDVSDWWDAQSKLSVTQRFTRFLADIVLARVPRVVVFIDEIDSTIGLPFSDDYFAAIRAVYQRRAAEPRLRGLTFALLGVAAPSDLIKDPDRTPFNLGQRIELSDFTRAEATPLVQGLAPEPDLAAKLLDRVLFWTGGHPYLSQKTCQLVAKWAQEQWDPNKVPSIVDETVKESFFTPASRKADSNLQLVSDRVSGRHGSEQEEEKRKLLAVYAEILRGVRVPDEELDPVKVALKLSGLVVAGTAGLQIRNAIYRTVFDEAWVRSLLDEGPPVPAQAAEYDVFVSYSHDDGTWVEGFLIPELKAAGLKVASDLELAPGDDWRERLKSMREASEFFLPVLSPAWAVSRGAQEEFEIMSNRVGKIVPVLLRPTRIPSFLSDIYYADFTDPVQQGEALERLVAALGGRKAGVARSAAAAGADPRSVTTASPDELVARLESSFDRDGLVKLAADRFPEDWQRILRPVAPQAPAAVVAAALVDFAARNGRLQDLADAVATARSAAKPETPRPSPATSGAYHAFVAMPFGQKQGIDFNSIYQGLVRVALESAGFTVFRADEELRAGDIRADMFQELLLADLVVADLSIDNPNVWYELGVRHALRARGVIQIQGVREYMPFDVYVDRALRYHIQDGKPDPAFLEADRAALAAFARETIASWYGRKISPVYHLLPYLQEPDWKSLRLDQATEFWAAQDDWERRVQVARRLGRAGDIMVLADEAPSRALRAEAYASAARALLSLGQFKLALEQVERALEIDPQNVESRSRKALLLSRLKRFDESREWLTAIVKDRPRDAEAWGLLGRVDKEAWIECWRKPGASAEQMRGEAADEASLLRKAIDAYVNGFTADPRNYYTGVNAVTLLHLLDHLTGDGADVEQRTTMEGAVRWAVTTELRKNANYWARITAADLAVLGQDVRAVERAYRDAVAVAEKDWFQLNSSRQQLALLGDLQFRPEVVEVALRVIDRAIGRLQRPEEPRQPAQVILFSGHMLDRAERPRPRFPPSHEGAAAAAIDRVLGDLNAGPGDLALCGGANGGDILFAEACLRRGLRLEVRIPFEEPRFLRESVTFAGDRWRDRFYAMKTNPNTRLFVMPEELGSTPASVDSFARNNLWQLYSALAWGDDRLRFVCLWDGKGGDGPGGTRHMFEVARQRTGRVYHIDTNTLGSPA